jgi:hypothetical protein
MVFCNPVLGGISGPLGQVLQVGGVSRIATVKYGLGSSWTQTPAGLSWRGPAAAVNYRPVLSSERALQDNKPATVRRGFQGEGKIGHWSQMGP